MSKPVMQIMLSLPSGERLTKATLICIGDDCARAMGFAANQYITILHKDTDNQHLHMIANRVGFNGSGGGGIAQITGIVQKVPKVISEETLYEFSEYLVSKFNKALYGLIVFMIVLVILVIVLLFR